MRQDVKLGLAIGGVLLAVLIVYVLVVPGDNGASDVQLVDADGNALTEPTAPTLDLTQPADTTPTQVPAAPTETAATDPFEPSTTDAPATTGDAETVEVADARATASSDGASHDWAELLSGQAQLPALMTETPTNANRVAVAAPAPAPAPLAAVEEDVPAVAPVTPSVIDPAAAAPADASQQAPVSVATTHVVRSGETLSSISAAYYGSSNYYPHLVRANPQINPNRLKVGTTINVPALSDVRPPSQQAQATQAAAIVNPAQQYKVGPGDSLYTISIKLYGKANRVDDLYEANRATIGPDPAKLKAGTVLTLPEPPSVATR